MAGVWGRLKDWREAELLRLETLAPWEGTAGLAW